MKKHFITFLLLVGMTASLTAQQKYQPTEANLKARSEFQDNKFGIFLHWGLYAMLATGEWTMTNNNMNYKEYAKLAGGFDPSKFDADKWVAAIKASGLNIFASLLVITRDSRCSIPSTLIITL